MDILKLLTDSADELYEEDLDFFETELATGEGYDENYRLQCYEMIETVRTRMNGGLPEDGELPEDSEEKPKKRRRFSNGPVVGLGKLAPEESNPAAASMTPAQIIEHDISALRVKSAHKTAFRNYLKTCPAINAGFLDENFSFFTPDEMDVIVSSVQLGEEFLEKYFDALNHEKIARYQLFSESFFMTHFTQLNALIVLEQGKNKWRHKGERSKQLDVFLRLKGVKI